MSNPPRALEKIFADLDSVLLGLRLIGSRNDFDDFNRTACFFDRVACTL